MVADLKKLADYTVRAWKRDAHEVRETSEAARSHTRERAQAIRAAIEKRDFDGALDAMATAVGRSQWHLIECAFPLMTASERAICLGRVWCESKIRISPVRTLSLFRKATGLRHTVPAALPGEVPVYRGAWKAKWRSARHGARNGLSWSTDREVALAFAELPLFDLERLRDDETKGLVITNAVGCLATAAVPRDVILAYFHDEVFGVYHEHECIIDPATVKTIRYEAVETGGARWLVTANSI